ncbi:MAG: PDZ domain-containing protein [Candidatus Omnitrophica bacterium]|nr:PDZ domain-containing protein [Candidatus Omnitrophota bacterium]
MKIQKLKVKSFNFYLVVFTFSFLVFTFNCYADTVYLKDGTTEKGLVVEEFYDRFIFSTPDGEKALLKSKIDDVFFDESYQNNLYLGKRFEDSGDFEKALRFYKMALVSNPLFKEAEEAIKGLEDSKWRFKKTWTYRKLKAMLAGQLGIGLKKSEEKIIINTLTPEAEKEGGLMKGDAIIRCWSGPLTYAGLKNASRCLIGLSNTILEVTIERNIKTDSASGIKLFSPLVISMEYEGPTVKLIRNDSPFYKIGLREGDLITAINNESTRYMKLAEVRKGILKSPKGKIITIRRGLVLMRKRSENGIAKAMWVWHTKEILLEESARKELLEFCKAKNIRQLFFQLQYRFSPAGPETVCRLLYETRLRSFLKEAHARGLVVYALDGSPDFCLEQNHKLVFAQVKAILDFNKNGATQERFDGIHYDNEPYLLPAFQSSLKEEIINQFVALNREAKALIGQNGVKLEYGIDCPFWFDEVDSLYKRLIDICDIVGIMDYRNFALSPDGMIAHAMNELKYASQVQKKIIVGVETSRYPKQQVYFVSVLSADEFNKKAKEPDSPLMKSRFLGFSLRAHTNGANTYIGLVRPDDADEEKFIQALSELEMLFGRIRKVEGQEALDTLTFDIIKAISENPEYKDIRVVEYQAPDSKACLMFAADEIMLEKLTFADLTEEDMNNVLKEAKAEFENYPAFAGFAIHYYRSYRELCNKRK